MPPTTTKSAPGADAVEPPSILTKAFDLLRAFNPHERVMTLSELARAAGLPKSTVHRLLIRLVELGAVEHHRSGYKLGLGLLQLGAGTPAGYMRDLALPHLAQLHRWSGATVHFAVLREFDVVYLEKLASRDTRASITSVGGRLPANCTAIGKALLAFEDFDDLANFLPSPLPAMTARSITEVDTLISELRKVHDEGIARESGEAQPGLACVAAPVRMNGFAIGAVSVGHCAEDPPPARVDQALRITADRIADDVGEGLAEGRGHWFPRDI
ncbi:DNA-binding IclR family transcriptional regulator [Nocardioides sp. BE266]|uniref:IclR family transcriptional regulator n=1 Tax=Nocardioides sp. BE266 TaxID=2817725 RepID=UPI002866906D|nr:IclR family transcriptional regulator [Nocardioides sp. BE266]MDR7254212.1 DNA-binding IclR family transcriptional regulator [Nocardioides sp. BE266]